MELYCPLVTPGCYCIVEDTKMSRWSSTGPQEAVLKFLKKHPEFHLVRQILRGRGVRGQAVLKSGTAATLDPSTHFRIVPESCCTPTTPWAT